MIILREKLVYLTSLSSGRLYNNIKNPPIGGCPIWYAMQLDSLYEDALDPKIRHLCLLLLLLSAGNSYTLAALFYNFNALF